MTRVVLMALALGGCSQPSSAWRLAGIYDASTVTALSDPDGSGANVFTWQAPPELTASCGPPWMPLGLGVADTVAMSTRLTPTLAVLLERDGSQPVALRREDVQLRVQQGSTLRRLEPAVLPRPLRVSVDGDAPDWEKAVVRQQIVTSLCLEHKLGRAWVGGSASEVEQALLLDQRQGASDPTLFFVGLGGPVPPLLGPEDACVGDGSTAPPARPEGLDATATLEPGDIWNAGLLPCETDGRSRAPSASVVPLHFGAMALAAHTTDAWSALAVTVSAEQPQNELSATLDGAPVLAKLPLSLTGTGAQGASVGVPDVIGALPRLYPTYTGLNAAGTASRPDGDTYALLLVPAWQLLPQGQAPGPVDPVGAVLDNPVTLSVEVAEQGQWWELNPHRINPALDPFSWGYPLGGEVAEDPVGAISPDPITGEASSVAYRAEVQGGVAASFFALLILGFAASGRVSDLWRRPPELRLERWVDRPPDEENAK